MTPADLEPLSELLGRHGLAGIAEEPFPNDGWSGAVMTLLRRPDGARFVLKRDSLERDWIARTTADLPVIREAWFAVVRPALPWPVRAPYLGAGLDGGTGEIGILMPDLSGTLLDWTATLAIPELERVLAGMASLHGRDVTNLPADAGEHLTPWRERISLICRPTLERAGPARDAVADRILPGWDAWDRLATPGARDVVASLAADPGPLLAALAGEPSALLHGDLKLANVGLAADGGLDLVDWQMVLVGPVAIELGWFLVSNVAALPLVAGDVLERYRAAVGADGAAAAMRQADLAILVGLLLRGWRKGSDAAAGATLASGLSAAEDLASWCERAVEAARRL